ncbi:MAG: hypothetical protein AAGF92_13345 [Myxococcota bacterium]
MKAYLLLLLLLSGCAPYVQSPPGRMLAFETAKSLEKGQTGIRVGGGGGIGSEIGFAGGFVRVRHGVAKNLDFRVDLTALSLNEDEDEILGTNALATAGAGIKYAFNPYFAVAVDLTGGYWTGGGFLSPELRFIAAYENRYFVPFIDLGYFSSHPLSPNDVEFRSVSGSSDDTVEIELLGPPVFTQGWTTGFGFRIPTSSFHCCRLASAIIFGTRFTGTYFDDEFEPELGRDREVYWSGSVAFELIIPGTRRKSSQKRHARASLR